jgi:ribosomal-protein-alanine N-acetyltransferase
MRLVTARLRLREFRASDYPALREIDNLPQVLRYEHVPYSEEESRARIERALEEAAHPTPSRYHFAITIQPADLFRGWVTLALNQPAIREYEIGWTMHPGEWGQGYASEAASEVLHFAFHNLGAHRVVAFCHAGNLASRRVMEKLGMQCEGYLREVRWLDHRWYDEWVYAILEREFTSPAAG